MTTAITPEVWQSLEKNVNRDHMIRHAHFVCDFADELAGAYSVQVTPYDVVVMGYKGDIDAAFERFGIDKSFTPHRQHSASGKTFRAWKGFFNKVFVELVEVAED